MTLHLERLELVRRDTETTRDDVSDIHRSIERKLYAQKEALQRSHEMMNSLKGRILKERHSMQVQEFRMTLEMARKEGVGAKKLESVIHDLEGHAEKVQRQLQFYSKKLEVIDQKSQLLKEKAGQQKVEREAEMVMDLSTSRRFSDKQRVKAEQAALFEQSHGGSGRCVVSLMGDNSMPPQCSLVETLTHQDEFTAGEHLENANTHEPTAFSEQISVDLYDHISGGEAQASFSEGFQEGEKTGETGEMIVEADSQQAHALQSPHEGESARGERNSCEGGRQENKELSRGVENEFAPSPKGVRHEDDLLHSQGGSSAPEHWSQGEHHRVTFTVSLSSSEKLRVQIERKIENKLSLLLLAENGEILNLKSIKSRLAERLQSAGYTLVNLRAISEDR